MNKQEKIQIEVDKTLSLFDKKESLPPNPYLYTRIQQQLKEKSKKEFSLLGVLKPVLFTALIALNLTTAVWYTSSDNLTKNTENNTELTELVDVLKSDFNLENDKSVNLIFE